MPENLPHRPSNVAAPMQTAEWSDEFTSRLQSAFPAQALAFKSYLGQTFLEAPAAAIADLLLHLRQQEAFDMLIDLSAVDFPSRSARFELIYALYSLTRNRRLRVKVSVMLDQAVPSVTSVYASANWLEREVFDMFGIHFTAHPDLKRILLPENWTGFPLRKDMAITAMDNDWVRDNLGIESGQ